MIKYTSMMHIVIGVVLCNIELELGVGAR
jgi:hypothetical protein